MKHCQGSRWAHPPPCSKWHHLNLLVSRDIKRRRIPRLPASVVTHEPLRLKRHRIFPYLWIPPHSHCKDTHDAILSDF
ncbi:hypothetical protein IC582_022568 [Cucumis melo]